MIPKTAYIITKLLILLSALSMLVVGGFLVYAAQRSIRDTTGTVNPEISLLLWPGIVALTLCLFMLLALVLIRKHHAVYWHYASAVVSASLAVYVLYFFFG